MKNKTLGRLLRRLFYLVVAVLGVGSPVGATGPTMTTITDVVYRANGQPAAGTILVSWPGFNTADNKPVAAGVLSIVIGAEGTVNFSLVPNEGGDPGGTFYKAIYKLKDGTTFTEYWVVPAASPTTIAAIRASVVPRQVGAQFVNRQYVDTAVATTHEQVVHKTGSEGIAGVKTFAASPEVPAPASGVAAVNKDYVTGAISAVSDGFVDKSGDTMSGPLTVPNDPVASGHATNRQYVDLQVADVASGLTQKLGRLNDTPISLAAVRYANQFALGQPVSAQVDAACADLSASDGSVWVPSSTSSSDISGALVNKCLIQDYRGTGGMHTSGAPATYSSSTLHGTEWLTKWTSTNIPPQTFSMFRLFTDIPSGGVNTLANKSNYQQAEFMMNQATPGQTTGITATINKTSVGDAQAVAGLVYTSGGAIPSVGDEGAAALRGAVRQHTAVFAATVASVAGNVITYSSPSNETYLGEKRFLINTSANVYSTGTATTGTGSATITEGGGADWEATVSGVLDGSSNPRYGFSLDHDAGNPSNNYGTSSLKRVVPITAVAVGGTTATVRDTTTFVAGSTNTYKIFKGSQVESFDATANTITVSDGTQFAAGNTIELPLDTRFHFRGINFDSSQAIAQGPQGTVGIYLSNGNTVMAGKWDQGILMSGNANSVLQFSGHTLAPQYGVRFNTGSYANSMLVYAGSNVDNEVIHLGAVARNAATGGDARLSYLKSVDMWQFSNNTNSNFHTFSTTGANMAVGGTAQSGVAVNITPDTNDKGIVINGNATGDVLDAQVSTVSRFRLSDAMALFNNGVDVKGYSDNQVTQKWQITGSSGKANFNGGVCLDSAQTICEVSGGGAPTGACVTGSTYKRSDGGSASTLYVCESTAWVAVGGGGSSVWSTIGNPSGAQALAMGANTTTWTWNAATGSSVDLVRLIDTASNTGTGHILSVETAASSNAKPFQVKARGTTSFEVNEFGTISTLGGVTTSSGLTMQVGGTLVLKGRDDWTAPVTVSGADFAGSSATASNATLRAGDATSASGSTTGGTILLRSGGAVSASGVPGNLQVAQTYLKDTTVTSGYLQCFKAAAAMTVGDCGNSATNSVGVVLSASNTNPVVVQFQGVATLQFDATASPSAGWFACSSASAGGKVVVQSGACAAGRQVGIVAQNGTSITSGKVFLQSR